MISTKENIVAFVDILGFSDFIKAYDLGNNPNLLLDLKQAVDSASEFLKMNINQQEKDLFNWKQHLKVKLFSDCLCASIPTNINHSAQKLDIITFLFYISTFQNLLIEKGFFTRGGISIGSFYSDENMIFSGALVESVELEKKAIYPRVLVSQSLINLITGFPDKSSSTFKEILTFDEAGNVFVNNLNVDKAMSVLTAESLERIFLDNPSSFKKLQDKIVNVEEFQKNESIEFQQIAKTKILNNLKLYQQQSHIFEKYLWLKEIYDWNFKNKRTSKFIKFE
jgi:hypothetical protein